MLKHLAAMILILELVPVGCATRKSGSASTTANARPNTRVFYVRGQDAADFKSIISDNCASSEPFFDTLTCLYNVDDDGNGNFLVSRSCDCVVHGVAKRFKADKDVLRISEIMANLEIGEPGPRPGNTIYALSKMTCVGESVSDMACEIQKTTR